MTSATGDRRPRERGFTMIEMLITISIILILFGMLVVAAGTWRERARVKRTEGTLSSLGSFLELYKSKVGSYPSDGIDERVETKAGTRLQSGAALTYALLSPVRLQQRQSDGSMKVVGEEDPVGEFKGEDIGAPYQDDTDAREIRDGFGQPFHYDRLGSGRAGYSRQGDGDVHLGWEELDLVHGEDPREMPGEGVETAGSQNIGQYDLWSHGKNGHTPEEASKDVIPNWRVPPSR